MSTVDQIESAILQLAPEDFQRLMEWLWELEEQRWDAQIAADSAAGKLDRLPREPACQPTLMEEHLAELERRADEMDSNPDKVVTWESIMAYVRRKR